MVGQPGVTFGSGGFPSPSSHNLHGESHASNNFRTQEWKVVDRLQKLGKLLPNYAGLSGMKDEFAQMLYSSSSNLFSTHKDSHAQLN